MKRQICKIGGVLLSAVLVLIAVFGMVPVMEVRADGPITLTAGMHLVVVDGEIRRDKDPDHYLALRWPAFTDAQNEVRRQLDVTLFATFPDEKIYNGPVVSFLCRYFDEQQAWTAEEQKEIPEYKMDIYRQRFRDMEDIWRGDYPQADIIKIEGSHYTCMHNDECLKTISDYVHTHCL